MDQDEFSIDRTAVRISFDRAAETYDQAAKVQRRIGDALLDHLDSLAVRPERILDAGAGTGAASRALKIRFPESEVIALDWAPAMLAHARRRSGEQLRYLCADVHALPLASESVDLVFSNMMLQWCPDLPAVVTELHRILRPGGVLLFSTLGPATLYELRDSWAVVDGHSHVNRFLPQSTVMAALHQGGLVNGETWSQRFVLDYDRVSGLMRDLKAIGANNRTGSRARNLTGRSRLRALALAYERFRTDDGHLPATYEAIFARANRVEADASFVRHLAGAHG